MCVPSRVSFLQDKEHFLCLVTLRQGTLRDWCVFPLMSGFFTQETLTCLSVSWLIGTLGSVSYPGSPPSPIAQTPALLYRSSSHVDWLVVIGSVGGGFGVTGFLVKVENSPSFLELRLCLSPVVPDFLVDWLLPRGPAASQWGRCDCRRGSRGNWTPGEGGELSASLRAQAPSPLRRSSWLSRRLTVGGGVDVTGLLMENSPSDLSFRRCRSPRWRRGCAPP